MSDEATLGDRFDAKLAELRAAIAETAGDVSERVNTVLDELQALVADISAGIDEKQGQ